MCVLPFKRREKKMYAFIKGGMHHAMKVELDIYIDVRFHKNYYAVIIYIEL